MLHRGERRTLTTKTVRETEAEAVAFVVCQAIALDTGSAFSDYIALWSGNASLLRESLEAVQHTAAVILGGSPPSLRSIQPIPSRKRRQRPLPSHSPLLSERLRRSHPM